MTQPYHLIFLLTKQLTQEAKI